MAAFPQQTLQAQPPGVCYWFHTEQRYRQKTLLWLRVCTRTRLLNLKFTRFYCDLRQMMSTVWAHVAQTIKWGNHSTHLKRCGWNKPMLRTPLKRYQDALTLMYATFLFSHAPSNVREIMYLLVQAIIQGRFAYLKCTNLSSLPFTCHAPLEIQNCLLIILRRSSTHEELVMSPQNSSLEILWFVVIATVFLLIIY